MQQSFFQGLPHVEVSLSYQKHVFQSKYVREYRKIRKKFSLPHLLPKVIDIVSFILLS